MRFALAIASLVIAGVLLILGIGQRTFLAGPAEINYPAAISADAAYAVIPGSDFTAVPGQANIRLTGDDGFAAVGSTTDIEAWLAPMRHTELAVDTETGELVATVVPPQVDDSEESNGDPANGAPATGAEEETEYDARGSDLWLTEQEGAGRLAVSLTEDQSIIVQAPTDGEISAVWVQDQRTPLAGPLLVAGGFFAILGLILYLLAVDHDRRGLGPRRGSTGPLPGLRQWLGGFGPRRRVADEPAVPESTTPERTSSESKAPDSKAPEQKSSTERRALRPALVPVMGLAVVLTLSGCSAAYWPEFSQDETTEAAPEEAPVTNRAPVPVTETQIDRIVRDVARVAGAGDDALDAVALESRFRGDALAQRKANYQIRTSVPDYEVRLPRITDEQLDYELVQSTEGWPRTIFVTVASELPSTGAEEAAPAEGEEDAAAEPTPSPSLAMVLTQRNPHENFKVSRLFALRGGISMPPAAPVEEGTARLADDLKGLVLPPGEVGPAYAAILAGGPEVEQAELFDLEGDSVIAKSGAAWVATARQSATDAGTDVDYSVSAAQSDGTIVSLSTGVEGALVATTVRETRVEAQTGDYQPTAVGAFAALSGLTGRHERLVSVVAHQLLFFVPSEASGDSIQLLGYTTELVEANNS